MSDDVQSRIIRLTTPMLGLNKYINVRERVGPNERNQEVDVRIVGKLLQMSATGRVKGVDGPRNIRNSVFTSTIGFWIFFFQLDQHRKRSSAIIDGVVSPGNASGRYGSDVHTIVLLNAEARKAQQGFYDSVVEQGMPLTEVD
jgi:hypothetical protein